MGIDADSKSKTTGSVYSVSYYRPAPGHREQLEKMLGELPSAANDTTAGNVLMQHLEGADWTFLAIARYNSWDDYCQRVKKTDVPRKRNKKDDPCRTGDVISTANFHTDTLTSIAFSADHYRSFTPTRSRSHRAVAARDSTGG